MNRPKRKRDKTNVVSEKLDISFKMVNGYACNRQQSPLDILYKIAEILQVSVRDLLVGNKDKK
jgi:transcriptional regulator with XRE-family HTH domain